MNGFVVKITDASGATRIVRVGAQTVLVGKDEACGVRLAGWKIAREHARITRHGDAWEVEDFGHFTGTWVDGVRLVEARAVDVSCEIRIAEYRLRLGASSEGYPDAAAAIARDAGAGTAIHAAVHSGAEPIGAPDCDAVAERHAWRTRVHDALLETIDVRRRDLGRMNDDELRRETDALVGDIVAGLRDLPARIDRTSLRAEVLAEAVGLGPLETLLADAGISEIMVNRHDEIFVERDGRLQRHPLMFTSDRAVLGVIERIVAPLGRRIDEASPMVDARLKDGSRVNAIVPPLALKGPALTIRKFPTRRLDIDAMLALGAMSAGIAEFLRVCVAHRCNVVVSGGTGSGKTTLLNVLSNFIPDGERVVTIEDAAELRLHHSHLVALESRPANIEGRGAISIRDLVRNALRMRPDRIVVGECRGGEALDMLQAMNTGHEGSMTTLHANAPRDALSRLETLVLMAGMDLPVAAIREQIASAVDVIVQQTRFACGARRITSVCEVSGIENGKILMQELFRFDLDGYGSDGRSRGRFSAREAVPRFYEALRAAGVPLDLGIFEAARA